MTTVCCQARSAPRSPAEEKAGHAHDVTLALLQNGMQLSGYVVSDFRTSTERSALPSYVSLEKVKP
jgi:hypothetical protein